MHPCKVLVVVVKAGLTACVERTIKYENSGLLKVVLQAIYIPKVGGIILSTIRDDTRRRDDTKLLLNRHLTNVTT